MYAENFDLDTLFTPVDAAELKKLLKQAEYDEEKSDYLVKGFMQGFDIGYRGPEHVQLTARNLKLTIGSETDLWNKVIKEVQANRYAGPYEVVPYKYFIQSPIGLVPKDNGTKTRLIFHLSYPRNSGKSVNANTPKELTSVKYKEFDDAVKLCIKMGVNCKIGKSDMTSAFRHFCIQKNQWRYLIMKAKSPLDGRFYFFVDKCMPFGAAISCAIFQAFSDAISFVVEKKNNSANINYLDDFFFVAIYKALCDKHIQTFIQVCTSINFPVSMEKTFWGTTRLSFLGLIIDTKLQKVFIPKDKVIKARELICEMLNKRSKKTTLHKLQKLCGTLNFLGKSIVPGRAFTRRLYPTNIQNMKKHHHLNITGEMRADLTMWFTFLNQPNVFSRKFFEFDQNLTSQELEMYTDASTTLGCGGYHKSDWFIAEWDTSFMEKYNPSINYLELYAVTVAVLNWIHHYKNLKITLFCDNMSVVHMINNNSAKCKNCMVLIRIIVLQGLLHNVKITAKHVPGTSNTYADYLSRLKYKEFRQLARKNNKKFSKLCTPMPSVIWPLESIWLTNC